MKLDKARANPGAQVSFIGRNFNTNQTSSPVFIRWNNRNGAILHETRAAAGGKIRGTFNLPRNVRPGHYIILATQTLANGRLATGSPARAPIQILGSRRSTAVAPVSTGGGPSIPLPLLAGLGVLAVALLGGVSTMALRRRPSAPAVAARS